MRDLWVSFRLNTAVEVGDGGWQAPVNMGCALNSPQFDDGPSYFKDPTSGLITMFLTTQDRPGGLGDFDIWSTTQKSDGTWTDPVDVAELNTTYRDTRTAVRSDGLEMIFTSNRPGSTVDANGVATLDLWVSTRSSTSDKWGTPVSAGEAVNGAANDGAPALSADGLEMVFYSNRPGGAGANDLYVVHRVRTAVPKS